MLSVTPFKSDTAGLFGMAPRATSPAAVPAPGIPPPSVPAAAPPARVASPPDASGYEAYKDPGFVRDPAAAIARPEVAAQHGEKRTAQLNAEYADGRKAAEMDLFVLNAVLTRTFGLSAPVTRQDGGTVSFVAQDIAWNGMSIVRLSEDGVLTPLGPDGQPASMDQRA